MNYADASQLWQNVNQALKNEFNGVKYDSFFKDMKLHSAENNKVILVQPNIISVQMIKNRFFNQIEYLVRSVYGDEYTVEVMTAAEADEEQKKRKIATVNFNRNYTFDNFVVGNSNQLAHTAAVAVADDPGYSFNPLFIYGGVGLGKTHLMSAIANYVLVEKPDSNIIFTTSENFTNEVIDAIGRRKTNEFRARMRNVDILLIDDIQFLSNKPSTQEEFFHTFNALYENHKQIVLSSDRHPSEIETLEDRMRSRFLSGLVVDVQKPDFETRVAILMRMAEAKDIALDPSAASYIAECVDTNIRELEGSLTRVNAIAQLEKRPITDELARRALQDIVKVRDKKRITPESIMDMVAEKYHIQRNDILSSRRTQNIAMPRQLAVYLTREMTSLSTTAIGTAFGRDHSTILYACRAIEEAMAKDTDFQRSVNDLMRVISTN